MVQDNRMQRMNLRKILFLVMALTTVVQAVMISIAIYNVNIVNRRIYTQRAEIITDQFEKNIALQLSDVNNLLLMLHTPDITNYFRNYMALRDPDTILQEDTKLKNNLRNLYLDPGAIRSIYFISENNTQRTMMLDVTNKQLKHIPGLHLDTLRYANLETMLLNESNQLIRYSIEAFTEQYRPVSRLISSGEHEQILHFMYDLDQELVIANGQDKVLILIVLNDDLFNRSRAALGNADADYSVVSGDTVIWSSAGNQMLVADLISNKSTAADTDSRYTNYERRIQANGLRVIYTQANVSTLTQSRALLYKMLLVSISIIVFAFCFSILYLKKMFRPFHLISDSISRNDRNHVSHKSIFEPINGEWTSHRNQNLSLRHRLMILFIGSVFMTSSLSGSIYSHFLNNEVDKMTAASANAIAGISAASISESARFYENLANQIAVSQQLQNYLIDPRADSSQILEYKTPEPLKMFPGLNEISNLILINESGTAIYSSVYSNNLEIFNIPKIYLKNRETPYWLFDYVDRFSGEAAAVIRQVKLDNEETIYLLITPKKQAFDLVNSDFIWASYALRSASGQVFYTNSTFPPHIEAEIYSTVYPVNLTNWQLDIDYIFSATDSIKSAYQQMIFFSTVLVFLLAVFLVQIISTRLTRPIVLLVQSMKKAVSIDRAKPVSYGGKDEIGTIIQSYNLMIRRLEQTTNKYISVMEENAERKIQEKELLSFKTRAQLNMLQSQVNPHFLYNALAVIDIQSKRHGDKQTGQTVRALAGLLRYSLSSIDGVADLNQEINHVKNYFKIEQTRLGSGFQLIIDIPEQYRGLRIMRFTLQPLVENCIQHGFEGWESGGIIRIVANLDESKQQLKICIQDNGIGMDAMTLEKIKNKFKQDVFEWKTEGSGIGLLNVYGRMKLFYKGKSSFSISSELMKGTKVILIIPSDD